MPTAAWCAENLRDCKAFHDENLAMSTTSNESARLFDGLMRQYVSWIDCDSLGGIENSMRKLMAADPNSVMGRVLVLGLDVMGTGRSIRLDAEFAEQLKRMLADAEKSGNPREQLHARAIYNFAQGEMQKACDLWEEILHEHPNDLLAVKFAHDAYFYRGDKYGRRESIARVLPKCKTTMPCYSYLKGMYAFGLEECGEYGESEKQAREALDMQRQDTWSTHAIAHCMEMTSRLDEGIKFLESTVDDWQPCEMLACHNYWHNALYYIEKNDHEAALSIFDNQISKRTASGMPLDLVDASSLLYRLQLEGLNIGDRWQLLAERMAPHKDEHILAFNDVHIAMAFIGAGDLQLWQAHCRSLDDFIGSASGDNWRLTRDIGVQVCDSLFSFANGDYRAAVDRLGPIRDRVYQIGGSHAQLDVFTQLLFHSCLRSKQPQDLNLARIVLAERSQLKQNSPLADRLSARLQSVLLTNEA